jgi:hypothetical protein
MNVEEAAVAMIREPGRVMLTSNGTRYRWVASPDGRNAFQYQAHAFQYQARAEGAWIEGALVSSEHTNWLWADEPAPAKVTDMATRPSSALDQVGAEQ